ncbi:MAG TPA: hypothetical protein VFC63_21915 [Blastocatellia bacterium]|nr:hypothetical protein [Blastocatellia bacterium]
MEKENDVDVRRTVNLPRRIWDVLDADATRSRRSASKQLEAILVIYYDLEDEDESALADIRRMAPPPQPNLYVSDVAFSTGIAGKKKGGSRESSRLKADKDKIRKDAERRATERRNENK